MIRKGICVVVFKNKSSPEFLLLHRIQNWSGYELLKGGRNENESEKACLERELREEMGSEDYKVIARTNQVVRFDYPKPIRKDGKKYTGAEHRVYLIEFFGDKVKIDRREHDGFKFVGEKEVLKLLTWDDQKQAFEKVIEKYF